MKAPDALGSPRAPLAGLSAPLHAQGLAPQMHRRAFGAWLCAAAAGCSGHDTLEALPEGDEPRALAHAAPASLALVLSGGGLRGFAHLGVLQALQDLGVEPDLIVGTSVGAVVGGLVASGRTPASLAATALASELDPWGSWLVTPSSRSARLEALLRAQLGRRAIEAFPRRFAAVAAERASGCLVALTAGDAARAIVASAALPGGLAPVRVGGVELVDGCIGTPLPVRVARALGARHVIAVDVSFHPESPAPVGLVDSVLHAGMLMTRHLASADRAAADLVLDPALPPVPEVTLANRVRIIEAGAHAAEHAAVRLRALAAIAGVAASAAARADRAPGTENLSALNAPSLTCTPPGAPAGDRPGGRDLALDTP